MLQIFKKDLEVTPALAGTNEISGQNLSKFVIQEVYYKFSKSPDTQFILIYKSILHV